MSDVPASEVKAETNGVQRAGRISVGDLLLPIDQVIAINEAPDEQTAL